MRYSRIEFRDFELDVEVFGPAPMVSLAVGIALEFIPFAFQDITVVRRHEVEHFAVHREKEQPVS